MHYFSLGSGGFYCFWLFDINARHQPVKLPPCEIPHFRFVPWPSVRTLGCRQLLCIRQSHPVLFRIAFILSHLGDHRKGKSEWSSSMETRILNNRAQAINRFTHIRSATYNVNSIDRLEISANIQWPQCIQQQIYKEMAGQNCSCESVSAYLVRFQSYMNCQGIIRTGFMGFEAVLPENPPVLQQSDHILFTGCKASRVLALILDSVSGRPVFATW